MPAGKREQSNATFYTLLTFVGLFIIATAAGIIYYVKSEEHRIKAADLQSQIDELATSSERRKIGTIVGAKQRRKSRLGTLVDYLDQTASLITGEFPEDTSAEVKVETTNRKVKETLGLLAQERLGIITGDPNTAGLLRVIEKLKIRVDDTISAELAVEEQLKELQGRFDDAMTAGFEKEQTLLAEKGKYQQQVNDIKRDYDALKALMEQTTAQQVQVLSSQLDEEKANRQGLRKELLKTQAQLKMTEDMMKRAQQEVMKIKPQPDSEALAYKPDSEIILIDSQTKTVHLNIGSDDRVYRGLTFSVYDKSVPIPKDGRGKAEIEVFDVGKNISAARITRSEMKRPLILGDIVANLIWDSEKTNVFVIAGEFDLDSDGNIDYEAGDKIETLIGKWGGTTADTVSIDTDFVVLGKAPAVRRKPTFEEMEVDPMAMEKYEASLQRLAHYKEVQNRAQLLSIPIFNTVRFLYFIGYKTQSSRPGAF